MAFELPRLPLEIPQDYPQFRVWWGTTFQPWWQQVVEAIEVQEASQDAIIASIVAAQAAADAAQADADQALVVALAQMPELAPVTITADYLGVVDPAAQLPMTIQAVRLQDAVDVTTSAAWTIDAGTDAVTATVGAADGIIEITAAVGSDNLTVTSDYLGVVLTRVLPITFGAASAPATGSSGGGTTSSDTSFASFNSASMATVSNELTVVVGSAGEVQLSAPLTVSTGNVAPDGAFDVKGIWQWYDTGAVAWVDLGTEVSSNPDAIRAGAGGYMYNGTLNVSYLKTGLTPAASEKFRLQARNNSGTRVMYLSGTASAVGS